LIGQGIVFRTTYSATPNRRIAQVFLDGKDVREDLVAAGWAKVNDKANENTRNKSIARLQELERSARDKQLGQFNKDQKAANRANRNVIYKFDQFELFEKLKGRHVTAVVEQVRSGSTIKLYLPESGHVVLVLLSGVQSPVYRFSDDDQEAFAREARFFAELNVLNRDVTVVFEGIDKAKNFFGTVIADGKNLSVKLLQEGLAKFVDWSAQKTSNMAELKAAEDEARTKSLRMWSQPQTAAKSQKKSSQAEGVSRSQLLGRVVDIISVGTVAVLDDRTGEEVKVNLASVMAPRLVPRDKMDDPKFSEEDKANAPYAWEAKEFLRKRLVGQKVRCVQEYAREPVKGQSENRSFWSVYLDKKNVAIELAERGYVRVVDHRAGEQRSPEYEELLLAENRAVKKNAALHAPKSRRPVVHFTDLSIPEEGAAKETEVAADQPKTFGRKAQQERITQAQVARLTAHLPLLQRAGRVSAVVDRIFPGGKFKLWIDKDSTMIPFVLHSIRMDKLVETEEGKPGEADPAHRAKVAKYLRDFVYQRDVEVVVDSVDKRGNYAGTLFINNGKKDFAVALLEEGLASVFHPTAQKAIKLFNYKEYDSSEKGAQNARKNMWSDFDPIVEEERRKAAMAKRQAERAARDGVAADKKSKADILSITLTEIIDGSTFYYQILGEEQSALDVLMKDLNAQSHDSSRPADFTPKEGDLVAAKFTGDDNWYRGKIVAAGAELVVYYVDYGNSEPVTADRLRPLGSAFDLKVLPAQAHEGRLAYVRTPPLDDDFGRDAAAFFKEHAWDKPMVANVQWREAGVAHVVLGDPEAQVFVNAALLRVGLATIPRGVRDRTPLVRQLLFWTVGPRPFFVTVPGACHGAFRPMTVFPPCSRMHIMARSLLLFPLLFFRVVHHFLLLTHSFFNQQVQKLREQEATARKDHVNLWQYGDIEDDEE
jgi:staphylococcal nuclease domain-containing protein 1